LGNELNPLIRQQEEARRLQTGQCRLQALTRRETYLFRTYEPLTRPCQADQLPELVITQLQNHFY